VAAAAPSPQPTYRKRPTSNATVNASLGKKSNNKPWPAFASTEAMNAKIKTMTSPATTTARQPTARVEPKAITKTRASIATTTATASIRGGV
jgi:hypothetical protein